MTEPSRSPLHIERIDGCPLDLFHLLKRRSCPFWLDSAGGHPATSGWSFLGSDPFAVMEARDSRVRLWNAAEETEFDEDPLACLERFMSRYAVSPAPDTLPFIGGAVGWFSYDLARRWERMPSLTQDDTRLPEMRLAFYANVFAYDHQRDRLYRITRSDIGSEPLTPLPALGHRNSASFSPEASTFTPEAYMAAVRQLKEYIAAGDIYQANLTRRCAAQCSLSPPDLYLRLRRVNPAPFAAYLDFGDVTVLSASPERFLSLEASTRRVETRPIKGTRPRSADPHEDHDLAASLQRSEKDRAENLMIVDVHRNDLGRVCEIGSIKVPTLWGLESYATVHHLVSVVEGRLPVERSPLELVRAAFPAGSITGAPKLRAMEIIEELEPVRRGIYTGSIGYLGWDGGMDLSVAIRTLIHQQGWVHYGVGGGIVADSEPEAEYRETVDKARGLKRALRG